VHISLDDKCSIHVNTLTTVFLYCKIYLFNYKLCPVPSSRHHLSCEDYMENKRKNIRTVLCCVFYAHTYEQFLPVTVGLGLVFVHLFSILCVFFLVYVRLFCSFVVSFCCVSFNFVQYYAKRLARWNISNVTYFVSIST